MKNLESIGFFPKVAGIPCFFLQMVKVSAFSIDYGAASDCICMHIFCMQFLITMMWTSLYLCTKLDYADFFELAIECPIGGSIKARLKLRRDLES
jgi:hypothetical protein